MTRIVSRVGHKVIVCHEYTDADWSKIADETKAQMVRNVHTVVKRHYKFEEVTTRIEPDFHRIIR